MLRIFFAVIPSVFFALNVIAQTNNILPFTGIKYFREGIWGKEIEVTANGNTMVSNKIPVNTDFDIKLVEPSGFFPDATGKYYPGIKVLLLKSNKKDTLGYSPNIFSKNESLGFTNASFKSLTVTLGFHNKLTVGDTIYQYITFFDTKSKNKLLIEFPVIITDSLQTGEWIATASGTRGYNAAACGGINLKKIEAYLDSTYYPKSLYHNLRSAEMLGITAEEINKGKFETWVYDENMNAMPFIKDAKQYAAKTFTGKEEVNVLVQIPIDAADAKNKKYAVRYRWQSANGKKVLDIVNKFW